MALPGGCLTLNISEFPSDAVACSLSEVLETDVPQKYYLSARACQGILRRAEKRGKKLPQQLYEALATVGKDSTTIDVPVAVISFAVPDTDDTAPMPDGVIVTLAAAVS